MGGSWERWVGVFVAAWFTASAFFLAIVMVVAARQDWRIVVSFNEVGEGWLEVVLVHAGLFAAGWTVRDAVGAG